MTVHMRLTRSALKVRVRAEVAIPRPRKCGVSVSAERESSAKNSHPTCVSGLLLTAKSGDFVEKRSLIDLLNGSIKQNPPSTAFKKVAIDCAVFGIIVTVSAKSDSRCQRLLLIDYFLPPGRFYISKQARLVKREGVKLD